MLTFYTNTQVARYSKKRLTEVFGVMLTSRRMLTDRALEILVYVMSGKKVHRAHIPRLCMLVGVASEELLSRLTCSGDMHYVSLMATDGETEVDLIRANQFQFIVDFMEENPGVSPIPIPYTKAEVEAALSGDSELLVTCLPCVQFLNPFRNTYYFGFDLEGMSPEVLISLASRLTAEERDTLIFTHERRESYDCIPPPPLPQNGEGWCILAAVRSVQLDEILCNILFSAYPSWLYYLYRHHDVLVGRSSIDFLLNADFSKEASFAHIGEKTVDSIGTSLLHTLSSPELRTWNEMGTVLAMLGLQHKILFNDTLNVCPPYQVEHFQTDVVLSEPLLRNMKRLYPVEWNPIFDQHAGRWLGETFE